MCNRLIIPVAMISVVVGLIPYSIQAADRESLTVDDFEWCTDLEPFRPFDVWQDGWEDDTNGSVVGNPEAPFCEQTVVHSGTRALKVAYDNSTAMISEVERSVEPEPDFTDGGVMEALTLWYRGRPGPVGSLSYDATSNSYTMVGTGAGIEENSDAFHFAYKPLSGDATITVRIDSVEDVDAWAQAGVMIRETLDADSAHAMVAVTPANRAAFVFRAGSAGGTGVTSTAKDGFSLPHWIRISRQGSLFKAEHSDNGTSWAPVKGSDPEAPSQFQIPMTNNVYIGLAVSANLEDSTPCTAVFSDVTISGGAAPGPFVESADIGVVSNAPEKMYVQLTDTAGGVGTVYNEAGTQATTVDEWTQWAVALEDFAEAGVNLASVSKILLGVGDRANPQAGGAGTLYFDDIQTQRRMPMPGTVLLLAEDFEGLPLGPNVDESVPGDAVWTKTAPQGWTLDDSGVPSIDDPANGVAEWAGWSFADNDWWASVDDQGRSEFILAIGTAAIADSDEYDDKGNPVGTYNAYMSTPEIAVLGIEAGEDAILLQFDSSWQPESSQTATITAQFDDGDPVEVLRWESSSGSPFYHGHETNELVTVGIERPAGAKKMVLTFGYFDASNNWWWAIDNVEVKGHPRERAVVLAEDFDDVPLGPNVEEGGAGSVEEAWTDTPPEGWVIDESGVPGVGDPAVDGVTEWAGWAIAEKNFWVASDFQRREEFVLAKGNVAVADCDEWDDAPKPDGYDPAIDAYDTYLTTPAIDISTTEASTVQLKFDSSWRPEYDSDYHQTGNITASFDGGEPIEVLRWESDPTSANFKDDNSTNETIVINLDNPSGARTVQLTFGLFEAGNDWWWAIDNVEVTGLPREKIPVFTEDFEGLPLGPSVEEDDADPCDLAWTNTPPAEWAIDNSGVPEGGTVEWAGWSFADKNWWQQIGQDRQLFDLGSGIVAIADGDEWDDFLELPDAAHFNTLLTTPEINIAGMEAGSLELRFDSSWRDEDSQTAVITVVYDGGPAIEVMRWESQPGSNFHDDAPNEAVLVPLLNPAGAQTAVITFGMLDAGNDWWWAIDNIVVSGLPEQRIRRVFFANFEGLPLEAPLDEAPPGGPAVWTKTAPEGWTIDDSGVPGAGDPAADGVTEWAGWSFANKDWWSFVAADQGRSGFGNATGAVAIADCDEWDDLAHDPGEYNAFMSTPAIDVSGADTGSVQLTFDSAWQQEGLQTATITASYDGGAPVEVLRWESAGGNSMFFKDHAVGETVVVGLKKPAGAQAVVITFGLGRAGNNWFWAIDNLEVTGVSGGSVVSLFAEDFEGVPLGPPVDEMAPPPGNYWTHTPPTGWVNDDSGVPGAGDPAIDGVTEWAGWSFVDKDWWVEVAGDQDRSQFVLGIDTVAVVDPDEWDDIDDPAQGESAGLYNAFLSTPAINISGAEAGSLQLKFDSSWREEDTQTATITVQYDAAEPQVVLLWESGGGDPAFFKGDATNEKVTVDLNNPEGAQEMRITFGMLDAGNDWWWAIDNVEVVGAFGE